MAHADAAFGPLPEVGAHWRRLVENWAGRSNAGSAVSDSTSVTLEFAVPETGGVVTIRFMTTRKLLVAFMTDGHVLREDQLAPAAAAANAWNTEQLIPMLSVWDVRGPRPCLAGVCVLPLTSRMTPHDFEQLAGDWAEHARQMFTRCQEVFRL